MTKSNYQSFMAAGSAVNDQPPSIIPASEPVTVPSPQWMTEYGEQIFITLRVPKDQLRQWTQEQAQVEANLPVMASSSVGVTRQQETGDIAMPDVETQQGALHTFADDATPASTGVPAPLLLCDWCFNYLGRRDNVKRHQRCACGKVPLDTREDDLFRLYSDHDDQQLCRFELTLHLWDSISSGQGLDAEPIKDHRTARADQVTKRLQGLASRADYPLDKDAARAEAQRLNARLNDRCDRRLQARSEYLRLIHSSSKAADKNLYRKICKHRSPLNQHIRQSSTAAINNQLDVAGRLTQGDPFDAPGFQAWPSHSSVADVSGTTSPCSIDGFQHKLTFEDPVLFNQDWSQLEGASEQSFTPSPPLSSSTTTTPGAEVTMTPPSTYLDNSPHSEGTTFYDDWIKRNL